MSFLKKLFGGGAAAETEKHEDHKGFRIYPTPIKEGAVYRISARIEKEVDGEVRVHTLIRADTLNALDDAAEASVAKARQMIDEQGDGVFG
ncbi:HlyU family transcriptional regulator [Shimia biformata]|uniref:HlyU family transcriptional regulator n=1 Tax=Shimia biformata TaxID=1294299 RepID=UPI0019501699|nr:HlyU family transcriptional regulator [Shimia biformata]